MGFILQNVINILHTGKLKMGGGGASALTKRKEHSYLIIPTSALTIHNNKTITTKYDTEHYNKACNKNHLVSVREFTIKRISM